MNFHKDILQLYNTYKSIEKRFQNSQKWGKNAKKFGKVPFLVTLPEKPEWELNALRAFPLVHR